MSDPNCLMLLPTNLMAFTLTKLNNVLYPVSLSIETSQSPGGQQITWSVSFSWPFKAQGLALGQEGPCASTCMCARVCPQGAGMRGQVIPCTWNMALICIFYCPVKQLVIMSTSGGPVPWSSRHRASFQITKDVPNEATALPWGGEVPLCSHAVIPLAAGQDPPRSLSCRLWLGPQPLGQAFPSWKGTNIVFLYVSYHRPMGEGITRTQELMKSLHGRQEGRKHWKVGIK